MAERRITADGRILEMQADGSVVEVSSGAPSAGRIIPNAPDPTAAYEGPRAAAQTRSAQADAQVDSATVNADIRLANAQAAKAQAEANAAIANQNNGGGLTDAQKKVDDEFATMYAEMQASGGIADIRKQVDQLRRAAEVLDTSDTITGPVIGRLPDFVKQAINPDAINVREQVEEVVQRNLRLVLGAQFTAQEGERLISRAFNPSLQEGTNAQRVKNLVDQMSSALDSRESAIKYYEQKGTIAGWTAPDERANAMTANRIGNGGGAMAAGEGATSTTEQLPQEMQAEYGAFLSQWMQNPDPQAYAQFRTQLDEKYGYPADPEKHLAWANNTVERLRSGGATVEPTIPGPERDLSGAEQAINDAANNPLGAAVTGASDALSLGALNAVAPEGFAAINEANPVSSTLGQIGGAVAGVGGIASLGARTLGKAAPKLLGGGSRAQFGRNVAADATYGAGYGSVTEGDPLTGAALGAAGSAAGQVVGKGLGSAIGGLKRTAPAQALMDKGVRLSVGRQLGGGASRAEDLMQSIPFVGGRVRDRQLDSFQDFNRAAFQEGASPIPGFTPTAIGREGVEQFDTRVGQAYSDALQGRQVPLDNGFEQDLALAATNRGQLPDDVLARADKLIENHVGMAENVGGVTGEMYQRARRGLGKARNNANQIAGEFDEPYRDTMTGVLDSYDNLLTRGGGADVIEGLNSANAANKNFKILEEASLDRAKIGTQTGDVGVFTPSQLLTSARKAENKYGGADGLRQLGEQGQSVLPSTIPNSGTADRAMAAGALGTLGVGAGSLGGGAGYALGGSEGIDNGAITGGALAAALAALGTRGGQRAVQGALINRPQIAQQAGAAVNRRRGLFGSATLPFMLME